MRLLWCTIFLMLFACDDTRVSEQQIDFSKSWIVTDKPKFDFEIQDHNKAYNIYCTVRNSLDFPFSRIFISYQLADTIGTPLGNDLIVGELFDQKTGEPFGSSGLGDLYDHRFPVLMNHSFERPGVYSISLEQFNRRDTLEGVLAVGIRVEKAGVD